MWWSESTLEVWTDGNRVRKIAIIVGVMSRCRFRVLSALVDSIEGIESEIVLMSAKLGLLENI